MSELVRSDERIAPRRGLTPLNNHRGKALATIDIRRWLHLSRLVYKTEKIDLLATGARVPDLEPIFDQAERFSIALSLRTDGTPVVPNLIALKQRGLLDVCIAPDRMDTLGVAEWLDKSHAAGLPIRLQVLAPFHGLNDAAAFAERCASLGVVSVNLAFHDPFCTRVPSHSETDTESALARTRALAEALLARDIEVNVLWAPFCALPSALWPLVRNSRQFFLDHQQYEQSAYDLAQRLYRRSPVAANIAMLILLRRHTIRGNIVDDIILPWMLEHPWFYVRMQLWRRITRHLSFLKSVPRPSNGKGKSVDDAIAAQQRKSAVERGPVCSQCSLQFICDGYTRTLQVNEPELRIAPVPGEHVVSPEHFSHEAARYFDPLDALRLGFSEAQHALAKDAMQIITNVTPDRMVLAKEFALENTHFDTMQEGSFRWYSFSNSEKLSRPLGRMTPPFTIAMTVASGIAEYIGFSFGRHCKLMCPMEAYRHDLAVHVNEDGFYVLLRDGRPIKPIEFQGGSFVPQRIGGVVEPRIAMNNIDCYIVTQSIKVWEHKDAKASERPKPTYSILMVCTRYARRLQAVLNSIVHQQNFDLAKLEIVIAYVPGLDITDDIIDTMHVVHPELRILRSPFSDRYANAKGFMINESANLLNGEWVFLVDADTMMPPDFFARVDAVKDGATFIAPDGRKMLTPEETAKVLMGYTKPWEVWDDLIRTAGEYRFREARGVPIGYCQGVRASALKDIKYEEHEHFETADWFFGVQMIEKHGPVTRLQGCPVLHLDHGGSQWYGTTKQF